MRSVASEEFREDLLVRLNSERPHPTKKKIVAGHILRHSAD